MKQIIVMVAMVALGVVLAGFVMGFGTTASELTDAAKEKISYTNLTGGPDNP
jgi:FlaG/FlaF family flagellin (archaellin)